MGLTRSTKAASSSTRRRASHADLESHHRATHRRKPFRLLTYAPPGVEARIGARIGDRVLDLQAAAKIAGRHVPATMKGLLRAGDLGMGAARELVQAAQVDAKKFAAALHDERVIRYHPPVPDELSRAPR